MTPDLAARLARLEAAADALATAAHDLARDLSALRKEAAA